MEPQSAGGAARRADAPRLADGARVGRHEITRLIRQDSLGEVYDAMDTTAGSPVTLHLLDSRLATDRAILAQVAADVRKAAGVSHASLASVIELGGDGDRIFLVTELLEGHTLRELLLRKRATGQVGFGAKGAANIALHLAGALAVAHEVLAHGGVSLDSVVVSRSGRIKLGALGLAALAPLAARAGADHAIAPEVVAGGRPSAAADIYALGAVLYELLVGSPPAKGCVRPSEAVAGLPPAVDQLIARCMAQNPSGRPTRASEVREALAAALAERSSAVLATSRPSAAQAAQPASEPASLAESLAPGSTGEPAARLFTPLAGEERWLVSKGKLDYGPFSVAHVIDQIRSNQILPGHVVIDKDTGDRTKVEDHPLLTELVEAARLKRDEARRAQAEVTHAKQEKRRGATLYIFIAMAVIGIGGGAYLLYTTLTAHKDDGNSGAISGLESGSVEAKLSFPSRDERKARSRGRKSGSSPGGASGPAGMKGGWNDTVELDLEDEGGDERLDDSQVNPVLQGSGGGLGRCLKSTGTHNANVEFIVRGTGKVSQVRVNGETSSAAANCIRGVMKGMQFPSFDGQRSKHYFDMAF